MDNPHRSIPALPDHIGTEPVAHWTPWQEELVLSHIDPDCPTCAHPGPGCIARGYAHTTANDHPRMRMVYRWHAHRCPACDETRIYRTA